MNLNTCHNIQHMNSLLFFLIRKKSSFCMVWCSHASKFELEIWIVPCCSSLWPPAYFAVVMDFVLWAGWDVIRLGTNIRNNVFTMSLLQSQKKTAFLCCNQEKDILLWFFTSRDSFLRRYNAEVHILIDFNDQK